MLRAGTIVKGYFKRGYAGDVAQQAMNVVQATLRTYREAMASLLPTPSKSHYTFNLRDFSRVVQGVLLQEPSDQFQNKPSVMRLWTHEALRVFGDRLTDDTDRTWMCNHCSQMCKEVFKCDFQSEFEHIRPSDESETGYGTLRRAISASRCVETPSRHRRDSCPSHDEVGGFFVDFGPIRTASSDCPESRPNSLKITKETTHDLVWWTRRASTTSRRRATAARRDTTAPRRLVLGRLHESRRRGRETLSGSP
jgi:hypothetical protein